MSQIVFAIGTRPELIKVAPVIKALDNMGYSEYHILNTSQHTDLLDPYWKTFDLSPDTNLNLMQKGQSLSALTSRAISQIQDYIDGLKAKPKILLSQGDTTTVMASSMVSFYNGIDFYHLEAGLRSFDFSNPFPEEYNRRVAAINAKVHFAPTSGAKDNLLKEGVREDHIEVVGNTVIDSLKYIQQGSLLHSHSLDKSLQLKNGQEGYVLITCHRRENHGQNLDNIISAVNTLADQHGKFRFIWTVHPNPNVKDKVLKSGLDNKENVTITTPLEYLDLLKIMSQSSVILSDSGGIQEEAPSFDVPVLVMRETTERPEGVDMGAAFLVGANKDKITSMFAEMVENRPKITSNPYGDGLAAERVARIMINAVQSSKSNA